MVIIELGGNANSLTIRLALVGGGGAMGKSKLKGTRIIGF